MSLADAAVPRAEALQRPAASGHAVPLPMARLFHWLTAVLVLAMFASGILMTQLGSGPIADILFPTHKLCGALVLMLLLSRLTYRLGARLGGRWAREIGGRGVHRGLYAMALLVPYLGWAGISDFGARDTLFGIRLPMVWPEGLGYDGVLLTAHAWLAFGLIALVIIHIAVALQDYVTRGGAGELDGPSGQRPAAPSE